MSYCAIVTFKNGKADKLMQYQNSWGGSAFIWGTLFDKYLKDPENPYDNWLIRFAMDEGQALWDLANRQDLPFFERAVLVGTFDYAILRRENFQQFAEHLRQFVAKYPPGQKVCHLLDWAEFLKICGAEAVGFYATSVSENLWHRYDSDLDRMVAYDLDSRDDHFEVYEALKDD